LMATSQSLAGESAVTLMKDPVVVVPRAGSISNQVEPLV
jgi:hypothetical protein